MVKQIDYIFVREKLIKVEKMYYEDVDGRIRNGDDISKLIRLQKEET